MYRDAWYFYEAFINYKLFYLFYVHSLYCNRIDLQNEGIQSLTQPGFCGDKH